MDSFELNKIIGAILGTLLFVMGVGFLAEGIYAPIAGQGATYNLPEPAAGASAAVAAAPTVPLPELLAKADPQQGADSAKKCQSCHDFTEGGPNKTGPNLYDVVGRKIASHPGFAYSDALLKHANETWTFDNLNIWLTSPKAYAPGTKMTFVGIDDDTERANVIAYLRSLSKSPVPLPAVAAAAKPGAGAAAPAAAPSTTPAATTTPTPATSTTGAAPNATTAPTSGTTAPAATPAAPAATAPAPAATPAAPAATPATPAPAATAPAAGAATPATPAPAATAPAAGAATPAPPAATTTSN